MGSYEISERQVLAALYVDSHRVGDRLLDESELRVLYNVDVPAKWFKGIVADLEQHDLVTAYRDKESVAAVLKDSAYKIAHSRISRFLGDPSTLEIDWVKQEI